MQVRYKNCDFPPKGSCILKAVQDTHIVTIETTRRSLQHIDNVWVISVPEIISRANIWIINKELHCFLKKVAEIETCSA